MIKSVLFIGNNSVIVDSNRKITKISQKILNNIWLKETNGQNHHELFVANFSPFGGIFVNLQNKTLKV